MCIRDRRTAAFSYRKCSFAVGKGKECTARVVTARELGVQFSYTLEVCERENVPSLARRERSLSLSDRGGARGAPEASFCGGSLGKYRGAHYRLGDLLGLGRSFCLALVDFFGLRDEVTGPALSLSLGDEA